MRRHYLLGCIAVLALSGLGFWAWRHFDTGADPAVAETKSTLSEAGCPDPMPPSAAPEAPETRVAPAAKSANLSQTGIPALPSGYVPALEPRLMKDPEFRGALLGQHRVMLEQELRDLPKVLGLAAEQTERLFDLLAEQRVRTLENQWMKPEPGMTAANRYQETRARNREELAEFLGPSNLIRYDEFRSSLEGRAEVDSVRTELARGTEPLRQEQVEPFLAVVDTELQRLNQEISDMGPQDPMRNDPVADARRVELTVAANQRIADASRSILSSAQLAGLKDLYRRQRQQMESASTLNRLRLEAATAAPPAPPR